MSTTNKPPSDTSFRKIWDRAEYATKAATREAHRKEEGKARAEAKASGKKYFSPHPTLDPSEAKDSSSRAARLDVASNVGKTTLVPAGAGTGKRGRSAGFYCQECDLTFKDNLQFVEHLNSRQHMVNTGQTGEVRRAGVEEVRERIVWLARRRKEEEERMGVEGVVELGERLERRRVEGEVEREERRRRRREKRRRTEGGMGVKVKEEEGVGGGIIC